MPNNSNQTPKEPSSQPRKSNLDYSVDDTPEAKARYMELVDDYPNVVARRWAMLRGAVPSQVPEKKGR